MTALPNDGGWIDGVMGLCRAAIIAANTAFDADDLAGFEDQVIRAYWLRRAIVADDEDDEL